MTCSSLVRSILDNQNSSDERLAPREYTLFQAFPEASVSNRVDCT